MATDPTSLFALSTCYACYTENQMDLMELALLSQIALAKNPSAAVDAPSLLASAKCYACYTREQWILMKLALLAQIAP